MTLSVRHAAVTDVGLQRSTNEDAVVAVPPLYVVCDGMGGAQAGEVASGLAAETIVASVADGLTLRAAAERANAAVYTRASEDSAHAGMGTTLTALLLEGDVAHLVHVGDSRAYLYRAGELAQVSEDHSMVAEMVRGGNLTADEAATHPHRSVLTRALGTEREPRLDELEVSLVPGDVMLLCSDGLSGPVPAAAIARCLSLPDVEEAAQKLIREARRRGGPDNITALVLRVDEERDEAPAADDLSAPAEPDVAQEAREGELEAVAESEVQDEQSPGEDVGARGPAMPTRGGRRRLGWLAAVLAFAAAIGLAAALVLSSVFYVSVDEGRLAVYSGLPVSVGPVSLHAVYRTSSRSYESLTDEERAIVDARSLQREDAVMELARDLEMWP